MRLLNTVGAIALLMFLSESSHAQNLEDDENSAIHSFSVCLNNHAKTADLKQPNDISSAVSLMKKRCASWASYLKSCLGSGKDGKPCALLGVGLARSAASLKGEDLPTFQFGGGGSLLKVPSSPWSFRI